METQLQDTAPSPTSTHKATAEPQHRNPRIMGDWPPHLLVRSSGLRPQEEARKASITLLSITPQEGTRSSY